MISVHWSNQSAEVTFKVDDGVDLKLSEWDLGGIDWWEFKIDKMKSVIGSLGTDIITGLHSLRNRDGQMVERAIIYPGELLVQLRSPARLTDIDGIFDVFDAALRADALKAEHTSS